MNTLKAVPELFAATTLRCFAQAQAADKHWT